MSKVSMFCKVRIFLWLAYFEGGVNFLAVTHRGRRAGALLKKRSTVSKCLRLVYI